MSKSNADAYGCVFCRTGNEEILARSIEKEHPEVQVLFPVKMRMRRWAKVLVEERVALFPGYLFFKADESFDVKSLFSREDVFRVLRDSDGHWRLCGEDKAFAQALFEQNGVIGLSKAYFEGDRIRIVDGMLKIYEDRILRVNRRSRTAQVSVGMAGEEATVWLGYELLDGE